MLISLTIQSSHLQCFHNVLWTKIELISISELGGICSGPEIRMDLSSLRHAYFRYVIINYEIQWESSMHTEFLYSIRLFSVTIVCSLGAKQSLLYYPDYITKPCLYREDITPLLFHINFMMPLYLKLISRMNSLRLSNIEHIYKNLLYCWKY